MLKLESGRVLVSIKNLRKKKKTKEKETKKMYTPFFFFFPNNIVLLKFSYILVKLFRHDVA